MGAARLSLARLSLVALLLAGLLSAGPAMAQDVAFSGTLKTILDRGTILIGTRTDAVPFAFTNKGGQPVGFSVDLCHGIAEDVAAALNQDLVEPGAASWQRGIRIAYVPVTADARLPMVLSGAIDLECGSTTANAERAKSVAFSPVFFMAGTKLLVPIAGGAGSYRDLAGKTVAVGAGTTNGGVVRRLAASMTMPFKVLEVASVDAGFDAMVAGRADALASDDILLAGTALAHPQGRQYRIVGDFLSFEPYAIAYRRNDPDFAALVDRSFARMAEQGALRALYNRWFIDKLPNGETLKLPISAQLSEIYRTMGQPD
jgi:glutamate/aspartate transport system substrate-binding protein